MKKLIRLIAVVSLVMIGLLGTAGVALAGDPPDGPKGPPGPFLCPSAGPGLANAPFPTGELPDGSRTFLPGNNQAGAHANENALNPYTPGASPPPGDGNSDWSPIWPDADPS